MSNGDGFFALITFLYGVFSFALAYSTFQKGYENGFDEAIKMFIAERGTRDGK